MRVDSSFVRDLCSRMALGTAVRRVLFGAGVMWILPGACSVETNSSAQARACTEDCGPCEICDVDRCVPLDEGAACLDGHCHDGLCCKGCWNGSACLSGEALTSCGNTGAACEDCTKSASACLERACDLPCRFAAVAVGRGSTYALRPNHRLYAWGRGDLGQLGSGSSTDSAIPILVTASDRWRHLAAGATHVCSVVTGNELYCWGSNAKGQLGLGDLAQRNTPTRLDSAIPFDQVAAEGQSTCAIDRDGALYCWGDNAAGQLGLGVEASTEVAMPRRVGAESDWTAIALGSGYGCGIRAPGTLHCWGTNSSARLGVGSNDGTLVERAPTRIGTDADWRSVNLGSEHACAIKADATVHCWGDNSHGQLGTGTRVGATTPTVVGSARWQQLALGDVHTCGIDVRGDLYCWGVAESGNARGERLEPTAIATATPSVTIAARARTTCAITGDGTLQCWGDNSTGATGNSSDATVSTPRPTCLPVARGETPEAATSDAAAPDACPATAAAETCSNVANAKDCHS